MASQAKRVVASYSNYREAERAVDYLSDKKFPVERATIVGRDLEYVEEVTGRMGYGSAALRGALTGALVGLLVGWLFAVFNWFDPVVASGWLILDGLWFGTIVGALFGLLQYALLRGRRDFASIGAMRAQRYDVLVDEDVADQAERLIRELGAEASDGSSAERRPSTSETVDPSAPRGAHPA
jgi:uncharacterized membrane protein